MGKVLDPVPDTCKYSMSRVFKREHKKKRSEIRLCPEQAST